MERIHDGHMGIVKCRRRAQESVWWPGVSEDISVLVTNCSVCIQHRTNSREPLKQTSLPDKPWQEVGVDLAKCLGKWYLVLQDYYSRFLEVVHIPHLTSRTVILRMENIFGRHGIPCVVRSDGGTQFTSYEFKQFAEKYGFEHKVSSPKNPQSNGEAEKAVDIAKRILEKCDDPNLGLLAYRTTPLENGLSPAELLYGRRLRTTLPSTSTYKRISIDSENEFKIKDRNIKNRNKQNFDRRHRARPLRSLWKGERVWISDMKRFGEVIERLGERRYRVSSQGGVLDRNRRLLIPAPVLQHHSGERRV